MRKLGLKPQKGFTIIEVMIVLAVAGLIMTVVFIAVPQLQRNARDNQRQSIGNRLASELNTYAANNGGLFPFSTPGAMAACSTYVAANGCNAWLTSYITGSVNINDPKTGSPMTINMENATTMPTWTAGNVYISVGSVCSGGIFASGGGGTTANAKQYALLVTLERSGTYYCVDNG
jgi:prepilin-type N-terminal cleavage/methylation domain-containing protein